MWKSVLFMAVFSVSLSGALLPSGSQAFAKSDAVYTSWRNNMGAGGYDVVSFNSGTPQKGSESISTQWMGADWHFTTQSNLQKFIADPAKFAPQYGGYCAWALARGKLAKGSPDHWSVVDGKLYLNFNGKIKKRWVAGQANFITSADVKWPDILEGK